MLTPEELNDRRKSLGASDFGAILGLDPFKSAVDVWLSKLHGKDAPANWPMLMGSALEPFILDEAEKRFGRIVRKEIKPHPSTPLVVARLDGRVADRNEPIDAKTVGLTGFGNLDLWGEDGSDVVPYQYAVQLGVQAACVGGDVEHGHIAARVGPNGEERYYTLKIKKSLIEDVIAFGLDWWAKHVVGGVIPEVTTPINSSLLRGVQREAGKVIELPAKLLDTYSEAREAYEVARKAFAAVESRFDAAKDAIKLRLALEQAEEGAVNGFVCKIATVNVKPKEASSYEVLRIKERKCG